MQTLILIVLIMILGMQVFFFQLLVMYIADPEGCKRIVLKWFKPLTGASAVKKR